MSANYRVFDLQKKNSEYFSASVGCVHLHTNLYVVDFNLTKTAIEVLISRSPTLSISVIGSAFRSLFCANQFHTGALTPCHSFKNVVQRATRHKTRSHVPTVLKCTCNYAVSYNEMCFYECVFLFRSKIFQFEPKLYRGYVLFVFVVSICDTVNSEPLVLFKC